MKKKTKAIEAERQRRSGPEVTALKERMIAAKKRLPVGAIRLFIERFPAYDTYKKNSAVNNVYYLRTVDETIVGLFEKLAGEHEKKSNK